ncbi:D-alanyl-D-alanine carboxypeptidase family protein [Pseudokineococcus sp. 1T1Z-3]|uniref:D-alanyl-D-alanine carboxypeptidase family protein n=1 Tax=Pseudokineococcus sp. 1T1Z-3 TaxID=3132745 RepID=UPI0030B6BDA1
MSRARQGHDGHTHGDGPLGGARTTAPDGARTRRSWRAVAPLATAVLCAGALVPTATASPARASASAAVPSATSTASPTSGPASSAAPPAPAPVTASPSPAPGPAPAPAPSPSPTTPPSPEPTEQAPTEQAPVEQAPVEEAPFEEAPVEEAPAGQVPEGADGEASTGTPSAPGPDPAALAAYETAMAASAEAMTELLAVSGRAGAALEARDAARVRHDEAVAEVERQRLVAATAATVVARERSAVGRWASASYRGTEDVTALPVAAALLGSRTTAEVGDQLSLYDAVGRHRNQSVRGALDAKTLADQAHARAAAAEQEAVAAQADAETQAAAAEAALAEQRDLAAALDARLAATRAELGLPAGASAPGAGARLAPDPAAGSAFDSSRDPAAQRAASAVLADLPAGAGGCSTTDLSAYPNGEIPASALCPLQSAPGHQLRGDAARAFDAMSRDYATVFGTPICVTDSYRSLPEQISVKARKPALAATPGTSKHGLGRAVDLCGGVQTFGTPQHEWMVSRAPLYGFFHPSWAKAGGAKPEPWHFEFAQRAVGA